MPGDRRLIDRRCSGSPRRRVGLAGVLVVAATIAGCQAVPGQPVATPLQKGTTGPAAIATEATGPVATATEIAAPTDTPVETDTPGPSAEPSSDGGRASASLDCRVAAGEARRDLRLALPERALRLEPRVSGIPRERQQRRRRPVDFGRWTPVAAGPVARHDRNRPGSPGRGGRRGTGRPARPRSRSRLRRRRIRLRARARDRALDLRRWSKLEPSRPAQGFRRGGGGRRVGRAEGVHGGQQIQRQQHGQPGGLAIGRWADLACRLPRAGDVRGCVPGAGHGPGGRLPGGGSDRQPGGLGRRRLPGDDARDLVVGGWLRLEPRDTRRCRDGSGGGGRDHDDCRRQARRRRRQLGLLVPARGRRSGLDLERRTHMESGRGAVSVCDRRALRRPPGACRSSPPTEP